MSAHAFRVVLAFCFAMAAFGAAHASDILLNSDFRDGKTHWQGGCQEPSNMGGKLLVPLDPKKWTVIYQHFSTRASTLKLTIVYSLSSDCTLAQRTPDGGSLFTSNDLVDACGLHDDFSDIHVSPDNIALIFTVSSGNMISLDYMRLTNNCASSYSSPSVTGRHTYTSTLTRYWGDFDNDEFCLAFPPGHGTVSLLQVALAKIAN